MKRYSLGFVISLLGLGIVLSGCGGNTAPEDSGQIEADPKTLVSENDGTEDGNTDSEVTEYEIKEYNSVSESELYSDSQESDQQKSNPQASDLHEAETQTADPQSADLQASSSQADESLTIRMVGDILLHTPVEEAAEREDGSYDFSNLFVNTEDLIQEADIAIVNEEVIIGGESLGISGYPAFNAPYEVADALYDAGFDVTLQATNHALDKGKSGIINCLEYWDEVHPDMAVLGIHDSEDDRNNIDTFNIKGIKVAVLNYTYGTNGIDLPDDMPYAVDLLEETRVINDLEKADKMADFVIVCPHWGTEYRLSPDSMQEKWTNIFVENGADLIIGTHPHVIEPVEWVTDEDSGNEALVYYSLGNYVNWTSGTGEGVANRMVGGMADVTISRENTDEVEITDYDVIALVTDLHDGRDGVTTYRLSDYTEEKAEANEIIRQDPEFSLDYCLNLCDSVWGDIWE